MLVGFRCCLNFRHFPEFKKNYPFYPFLILKIILFSKIMLWLWLKLRQGLELWKDRKRIKISEEWKNFVELVNSHYITVFRCKNCTQLDFSIKFFVGVETPTYQLNRQYNSHFIRHFFSNCKSNYSGCNYLCKITVGLRILNKKNNNCKNFVIFTKKKQFFTFMTFLEYVEVV